jgi:ABC-type glycerol-3-phosphate transport system permease component
VSDEKLIEALGRQFYIEYGAISAGAVVTVIPMLVVFAILRKNILQGITTSGIKE